MSRKADYEIRTGAGDEAILRLTGDWSTTGIGRQGDRLSADLAPDRIAGLLYTPAPDALSEREARALFQATRDWIRRTGSAPW